MVVKRTIFLLILLVLIVRFVSSVENTLKIYSQKEEYVLGDKILVFAEITNIYPKERNFTLYYTIREERGKYPMAILFNNFRLKPGEKKKIILNSEDVSEESISGNYSVETVLYYENIFIDKKTLNYKIEGLKEIDFAINFCKDKDCSVESHLYLKNEEIFLISKSYIDSLNLNVSITYPNGSVYFVNLPFSFRPPIEGEYKVYAEITKEGYKPVYLREQIFVIRENPRIKSAEFSIMNKKSYLFYGLIFAISFLFLILFAFIRLLLKYSYIIF